MSARSIWLTIPVLGDNSADQTLWRIDPQTGAVKARAPLLANPVPLAADARSVWVANIDGGKVTRGRGRDEYREERRRQHRSGRRCHRSRVALD